MTSMVAIENTTNKGGGACWDFKELQKIGKICREHNLSYHLDGARLFNALVAKMKHQYNMAIFLILFPFVYRRDWVAPAGSVLLGSGQHIKKAIRTKNYMVVQFGRLVI